LTEYIEKYVGNKIPVRATVVINTSLVEEIRKIQKLSPVATIALGRALSGALLLASNTKQGHKVGLQFKGTGPLGGIYVEANYEGHTRGCVTNPYLVMDAAEDNFNLKNTLGLGELVVFNNMGDGGIYQGRVLLQTSEIGDDIAFFLYQSQQIPSIVSLGLYLDKEGAVKASGGVIVELMPGHTEELISQLEKNVTNIKSVSAMISTGAGHDQIMQAFLSGIDMLPLNHHQEIRFICECSEERAKRSLSLLEKDSNNKDDVTIICEFCGKEYHLSQA
jgi:molecular chaperone Hsp33